MRVLVPLILCLASFAASAQDLTGIWRGHFFSGSGSPMSDSLGIDSRYKFETQINQSSKDFQGVTYSYKTTVFYGKATCYGAINPQTKKVLLEEVKLLEVKSYSGSACLMTCFLQYSKVGNEEFLEGKFSSMSLQDSSQCGTGTIFLRKVPTSDFYKEHFLVEKENKKVPEPAPAKPKVTAPPATAQKKPAAPKSKPLAGNSTTVPKKTAPTPQKKPSAAKAPPASPKPSVPETSKDLKRIPEDSLQKMLGRATPALILPRVLTTRKLEVVQTITTSAKDVYIKIYDNGTIDNDTVSVYVDKKLIVSRQRLTEKAITIKLRLDDNILTHELIMVAENLGVIPPNTSLMVVSAGDEHHEVRITSTEQKNAAVLFKYQKN